MQTLNLFGGIDMSNFHNPAFLLVQPRNAILHIFEADVGVHVGRRCRRGVAELFLNLP